MKQIIKELTDRFSFYKELYLWEKSKKNEDLWVARDESKQLEIMTKRYNFVVDLLDEDQQRTLHQWYVETGVIQEEE
jgi:hypothetical protein